MLNKYYFHFPWDFLSKKYFQHCLGILKLLPQPETWKKVKGRQMSRRVKNLKVIIWNKNPKGKNIPILLMNSISAYLFCSCNCFRYHLGMYRETKWLWNYVTKYKLNKLNKRFKKVEVCQHFILERRSW